MGIVFASRLVPFISFDLVSYAAGLTSLSFWQFALATCLGIVPICLALAAVGAGMIGSAETGMTIILLAGCVTIVPFILRVILLEVGATKSVDADLTLQSCPTQTSKSRFS